MEGIELLRLAARELAAGRAVAESVVLTSEGSVARPAGARMLTLGDGSSVGTVGGGAPEFKVQQLAQQTLKDGIARTVTLSHATTGMVCGGSQLVGIRKLGAADLATLASALSALDEGRAGVLTVVWEEELAVSSFEPADEGTAGSVACPAHDQAAGLPSYANGRYAEPLAPPERVLVFGGGHVGRALVPALAAVDFEVTLFDDRPEVARPQDFPEARHVICGSYANVLEKLDIRPSDYVCVMTHGHAGDEEVVAQALSAHPRYLGCMGSRRKRAVLEGVLAKRGFSPEEAAFVELPIGLAIGAVTPAEIAVSIVARLIEVRREARGK